MSGKVHQVARGRDAGVCGCGGGGNCGCGGSACQVLKAVERPRFFAGQLLSDDDLRSEQEYMLAKNRLHNRYLHGWGVVCGLELGCGDCPGYVTVRSGYGIDPCGNDVLVPCAQQFDVIAAIRACRDAQRRKRPDCDPYQPPGENPCDDATEHWCITVRYDEQQRRPTTALRAQSASSCGSGHGGGSCGDSCGGACGGACGGGHNGNGNGNGNGGAGCGCGTKVSTSTPNLGACEPTRVLEGFRLGVVQDCGDEQCPAPVDTLRRTFLGSIVTCFEVLGERLGKRLSSTDQRIVLEQAFLPPDETQEGSAQEIFNALCRYRQGVRQVLEDERLAKHCTRLRDLDTIVIPTPGDESGPSYAAQARSSVTALSALLADHVRDCICDALMPPCPTDPCDDRIILGCVEVRDDDIVEVCGWSGRRYAGSFPALAYWLSVGPAIAWAICRFCCDPRLASRRNGRLRLDALLDGVDPSGSLRRSVYADDFSKPRQLLASVRTAVDRYRPERWAALIQGWLGDEP
ncbi:MAG: hypothetical protein ACRDPR_01155 [Nocardioidaceae bacterium]